MAEPWPSPEPLLRPAEGAAQALEARVVAVERGLLEHRFALEGRLAELERHFADFERRLGAGGGRARPREALASEAWAAEKPAAKLEEDSDLDDALCGFLVPEKVPEPEEKRRDLVCQPVERDMPIQELRQVADEQSYYQVKGSCWDASIFIGTALLPTHTNVGLFLSVVVNVGIQVLFSGTIWSYFKEPTYNAALVDEMRQWRYLAHTYRMSDAETGASLASRVCGGDRTLSYATDKAEWIEQLRGWLGGQSFLLCLLAVFLWHLTIFEEIFDTVHFFTSLVNLPWGHDTHIASRHGKLEIRTISHSRVALTVAVAATRLTIAGLLLYVGSVWLINTSASEDLILNAVALNFLLQCDEVNFSVFCPPTARALIQAFEPIPLKKRHRWPLELVVASAWLGLPVCMFLLTQSMLIPFQELKRRALHELCGGVQRFIFDVDALGRLVYAYTRDTDKAPTSMKVHRDNVVQRIIQNESFSELPAVRMRIRELAATKVMSASQVTKFWKCQDSPKDLRYAYGAIGVDSLASCAEAFRYCQGQAYSFVRAVCPMTCGCADPLAGLVQAEQGCPRACLSSQHRKAALTALPCVDHAVSWLNGTAGWSNIIRQLPEMLANEWSYSRSWIGERMELLQSLGCAALRSPKVLEIGITVLCGPMIGFCPVACGCSGTHHSGDRQWLCPVQCGVGLPQPGQVMPP